MKGWTLTQQLKYFKNKFHFYRVDFMDDVLASKLERVEEMLPLYKKEIGLPWVCFMYPNRFTIQESVVKILKETGCEWMKVGVQSADEDYRRNILKRRINEAFRLNKETLYDKLNERNKQINIAIIYQKKEIQTYKIIEQKINLLLSRLIGEL